MAAHGTALEVRGAEVGPADVGPPATCQELDALEAALGSRLPASFRQTLASLSGAVRWSWRTRDEEDFPPPFSDISSGRLEWSTETILAGHEEYLSWIQSCFSNPEDPYDAVWHDKLGFASVQNGDVLAVHLDPERAGWITYLSHEDGAHGYVMARSLSDLVERWVPLACPGPEDWQWLPFVPFDFGPIDPRCENADGWRALIGLTAAPPTTPPSVADDDLFDALVREYERDRTARDSRRIALRALTVCSVERVDAVLRLLDSDDGFIQEAAARRLGDWNWEAAIPDLTRVAIGGTRNGRIGAMVALRSMPGAEDAVDEVRSQVERSWHGYLGG